MSAQGGPGRATEHGDPGAAAAGATPVSGTLRMHGYSWGGPRRGFPWLGLALVAVGLGALVGLFEPRITTDSAVILSLGLIGLVALFVGRVRWVATPAVLLASWGLARVLYELELLAGPGWTWLFVGGGLLALYLYGLIAAEAHGRAIWPAALFLGIGALEVAGGLPGLERLRGAWLPVLLLGLGLLLLARGVTRPSR